MKASLVEILAEDGVFMRQGALGSVPATSGPSLDRLNLPSYQIERFDRTREDLLISFTNGESAVALGYLAPARDDGDSLEFEDVALDPQGAARFELSLSTKSASDRCRPVGSPAASNSQSV